MGSRLKIPNVLLPKYEYHLLDLNRVDFELDSFECLHRFVASDGCGNRDGRAHMVSGHYKRRRTGLFWWSHHMRNERNIETRGFVDKDYNVVV